MDFNLLANQYKSELLDNVLPFWLTHSQDKDYGGYFSCLNRNGDVYDTDKFIWMQGREVWLFAMLYNKVEKRQEGLGLIILTLKPGKMSSRLYIHQKGKSPSR